MSQYFAGAQGTSLSGYNNFSIVRGDQHNHFNQTITSITTRSTQAKRVTYVHGDEDEEADFAEYHDVMLGDILIRQDLGTTEVERFDTRKWVSVPSGCERTFFLGEVSSRRAGAATTCLIVRYSGDQREEAWREDFHKFSGLRSANIAQLHAINRSKIPLLLFSGDLVPIANFMSRLSFIGQRYLETLRVSYARLAFMCPFLTEDAVGRLALFVE
ncbi:hypothetical protein V5O48_018307 [Marasmius crinis-equi]|uniref:Uncharacterized protein n=1 Tax=Marasmius crinis-equi TaxID=585013 RepID=A0ABR3ELK0_9AGAR